jgi:hypothetical protein
MMWRGMEARAFKFVYSHQPTHTHAQNKQTTTDDGSNYNARTTRPDDECQSLLPQSPPITSDEKKWKVVCGPTLLWKMDDGGYGKCRIVEVSKSISKFKSDGNGWIFLIRILRSSSC